MEKIYSDKEGYEKYLKELDEIIEKNTKNDRVKIGSIVDIIFDNEENIETYKITGDTSLTYEDDIVCITVNSPLGRNIYNKNKNDNFKYEIDSNILTGKILDIR